MNEPLSYSQSVSLFDQLIDTYPDLERKGKTMPYTSLNGHMFSFLGKDGNMGLRLSSEDREAFLKDHNTQLMVANGAVMKEYVLVPDSLLANTEVLKGYLKKSHAYVAGLKPKPTKKAKK